MCTSIWVLFIFLDPNDVGERLSPYNVLGKESLVSGDLWECGVRGF